jgi:branched-chain amino acid transport system permease protein
VNTLIGSLIAGLAIGAPIFLVASGLVLVFSVMGVLNFAHAGFYLFGAFIFVTLGANAAHGTTTLIGYLIAVLIAGVIVACISVAAERVVFIRTYRRHDHLAGLMESFALLVLVQGICELIWGTSALTGQAPSILFGTVNIAGVPLSKYNLLLILVATIAAVGLWALVFHTRYGAKIRAISSDRGMAAALGIRVAAISTSVFVIGGLLAGIAGAIDAPTVAVDISLLNTFTISMFAAVILGGFGSILGALVASMTLGVLDSLLATYVPGLAGYGMYIAFGIAVLARMYLPGFREIAIGGGGTL